MEERYLIDTNSVIKYINEDFPHPALYFLDEVLDMESIISFITRIELMVWSPADPVDLLVYEDFINNSRILTIGEEIIQNTISIRKDTKIKLPDAMIAATALVNDYTLVSDNDKDFHKVISLNIGFKYLNPNTIT